MKRHALFVGVDQYADGHIPNLSCAVSDATDLHGFFKYGAGYDRVELLQNPAGKKEVLGAVREMTAGLGSGDFFLFFFAGHGFRVGENHVLVCAKDLYEDVKYEDDGLPLGQLKRRLSGSFDSALFLDACQSDILQTRGGEGIAERDLSLIHEAPEYRTCCGTLTIVTSCDAGQTAAELSEARHGLFTMAMLDLLKRAQGSHTRLDLSDAFRRSLGQRMCAIASRSGLSVEQRPRFSCTGDSCAVLLDGIAAASAVSPVSQLPFSSAAYVVCPLCGKHNDVKDTFRCPACGKDHLCLSHQSKEYYCCPSCAEKMVAENLESRLKEADRLYKDGQFSKAVVLYAEGASADDPRAQYHLGRCYERGEGVPQDYGESVKWYRKAAEQGDAEAQCNLGLRYDNGQGVERDYEEAVKWYLKSAAQGNAVAQCSLGNMLANGQGIEKNVVEAVKWYRKAAEQGNADAQNSLGACAANGRGMGRDDAEAAKWFRKAAEQGHARAQFNLGVYYANGRGVRQDDAEATKWFRNAAEQGHQRAQFNLGVFYDSGRGVEKNQAEAVKWYRLAADQGNGDARVRLAELENQVAGDGGEPDGLDDEERTVERNKADSNKRKTIPLRRPQLRVNLVEGGVSGGDRVGRYCGPMENGKPHGTGRFFSSSGYVYTGAFFNGVRSGKGKIEYKDGATYEGGFYEGEWSGEGTYTWPNGTKHIGQFRNGKFHGPGRQINPDGTSFTGNWEYGKFITYT